VVLFLLCFIPLAVVEVMLNKLQCLTSMEVPDLVTCSPSKRNFALIYSTANVTD
jgi:hypothetical protein